MLRFTGAVGTNDNDVVQTFEETERFNRCQFRSQTGVVTVQIRVNGTWSADIAITDLQSTTPATKVLVTTGQVNIYSLEGSFEAIRFLQAGAPAANVEGVLLSSD